MSESSKNAVVLIELADSEALIQRYGRSLYDLILYPEFVERVKTVVRPTDTFKTLGANRLLLMFAGINASELKLAINRLHGCFDKPVDALDEQIALAIHVGVAYLDPGKKTTADVIREAGLSLAKAKNGPKNAAAPSVDSSGDVLLRAVAEALELGEFHLYFQPKLHARFRSLLGAEALLRWHTKDKQVLMPAKFLGVVAQSDLILPLMEWVIKSAIARLRRWPKNFAIAVNLPSAIVRRPELKAIISDALAVYSIEPGRIILEMSEQLIIEDCEQAFAMFNELRALGVRISIGDFGNDHFKAYKGLTQLIQMARQSPIQFQEGAEPQRSSSPIDEIKIDRRLIGTLAQSSVNGDMVGSIIQLAHSAKIKVVGVGVEDEQTANTLAEMGCDELQGFGLGMPLPLQEFESRYNIKSRAFR